MPTSRYEQITTIMEIIVNLKPKSVLDIGMGFGKYGLLTREYLEFWHDRHQYAKSTWRYRIDGIEGDGRYITPVHEYIYDNLYTGDATQIVPTLQGPYDLALLIDVFEHIEREAGQKLIKDLLPISEGILICVPAYYAEQEAIFDNPYEIHRTHWTNEDLVSMASTVFINEVPNKRIAILGDRAIAKWERYKAARGRKVIKRYFPFLVPVYRKWVKRT